MQSYLEILSKKRKYYEKNREKILREKRIFYLKNRDKILRQRKEYYQKNKLKILERDRQEYLNKKQLTEDLTLKDTELPIPAKVIKIRCPHCDEVYSFSFSKEFQAFKLLFLRKLENVRCPYCGKQRIERHPC